MSADPETLWHHRLCVLQAGVLTHLKALPERVAHSVRQAAEKVRDLRHHNRALVSLSAEVPLPDDDAPWTPAWYDPETLADQVADDPATTPESQLDQVALAQDVEAVLATIRARERDVITRRFGLHDGQACTLEAIGQELGVTRERVRQIEAKGLRRLQHHARRKRLIDHVGGPKRHESAAMLAVAGTSIVSDAALNHAVLGHIMAGRLDRRTGERFLRRTEGAVGDGPALTKIAEDLQAKLGLQPSHEPPAPAPTTAIGTTAPPRSEGHVRAIDLVKPAARGSTGKSTPAATSCQSEQPTVERAASVSRGVGADARHRRGPAQHAAARATSTLATTTPQSVPTPAPNASSVPAAGVEATDRTEDRQTPTPHVAPNAESVLAFNRCVAAITQYRQAGVLRHAEAKRMLGQLGAAGFFGTGDVTAVWRKVVTLVAKRSGAHTSRQMGGVKQR